MRPREIKNKIGLTQNILGVTQALELIAAVKMKKAMKSAIVSRPFAKKVFSLLKGLSQYQKFSKQESFYFEPGEGKKFLALVISSDRGFCGLYNKNILKFAEQEIREFNAAGEVEIVAVGKKTVTHFKKKNYELKNEFLGAEDYKEFEKSKKLAELLFNYYLRGEYQKIYFYYTHYINPFLQLPLRIQILPLDEKQIRETLKDIGDESPLEKGLDYTFEPSFHAIIDELVLQLVEFEIHHAVLEAQASEHAARMMAMKRAMDNAKEIIKNLTMEYNKARQAQITAEVSEITSAKEVTI